MTSDRTLSGVDAVPAGLTLRRFPPRFVGPATESDYQTHYAAEMATHVRFGLLTAVVLWICVVPLAYALTRGDWTTTDTFAVALMIALILLAALGGVFARRLGRKLRVFTTGANLFTGASCIVLGYAALNMPMLTTGGLILTVMYAASFFRLQTLPAVVATAPYLIAMVVMLAADRAVARTDFMVMTFLLFVTELCALSAVYVNDHQMRLGFVQKRIIELQGRELAEERAKSDRLLLNVLPSAIATRLRQRQETIAETYPDVTILFSDVVGFTPLADKMSPAQVVEILNRLFSRFDELAARHGLEKIKTIGDAYMAASGVPVANPNHASAAARMALDMLAVVKAFNAENGLTLQMRIGLNTGAVVAGVIGKQKFSFDLWGDAVNTAARMESHGLAGHVQISEATRKCLGPEFAVQERGVVEVKGKGQMRTWLLTGAGPEGLRSSPSR